MRFLALGLALALCATTQANAKTSSKAKSILLQKKGPVKLLVGKTAITVEIADNDSLRTHGLSDQKSMDWNKGMLFVFPDAQPRTFWMIDCFFDLDIAYIDPNGIVRDVQTMRIQPGVSPQRLDRYPSASSDIMYALEVNRGWMTANNVKVGDKIPGVPAYRTAN